MSTDLTTVSPSTTVAEAATLMASRHIGSAIVCDGEDLVGIFTERDIVKALSQDFDAPSEPLEHWMTRDPKTVGPDADVRECLDIMVQRGFRHLLVTEGRKRRRDPLDPRSVEGALVGPREPARPGSRSTRSVPIVGRLCVGLVRRTQSAPG